MGRDKANPRSGVRERFARKRLDDVESVDLRHLDIEQQKVRRQLANRSDNVVAHLAGANKFDSVDLRQKSGNPA
jgi:hypothetical protein